MGVQDACTTKTKDRGEGHGHKQRENEAAVDKELFEGSAQNEQRRPKALKDDGASLMWQSLTARARWNI